MRLKTRFIILGVICSIFFISFKIIEPELEDGVRSKDSSVKRRYKGKSKDAFCGSHDSNELIEHFVRKYAVQWNLSVSGSLWQVAAEWVTPREIHPEYAPEIGAILHKLSTSKVVKASLGHRGTQLKMTLTLAGGQRVAFKPKWYKRDDVVRGKPYDGPDRHNGEIVAFHLNRILGYRRAPLVVGRVVDMEKEIKPVAERSLLDTFYVKDGNSCFYGKCMYCKGPETGVCAEGTLLEGAVVLWLPDKWKLKNWRHPWGRTYRDDIKAMWETDNNYCEKVKQISPYDNGPRLMDIVDAAVFDYLIGNADRHHYETFKDQPDSMLIMLDSAKSFGNPYHDEESILAPLYQCCRIRKSTWKRLELLKDGVLSGVLCRVLSVDPISPLLADAHYEAMDRRLLRILQVIETCTDKYGKSDVLVVDRYSSQDEDDS